MASTNTLRIDKFFNISDALTDTDLAFNDPINRAAFEQIRDPLGHHARGMKDFAIVRLEAFLPINQVGNIVRANA
jgi:hypothetical protein